MQNIWDGGEENVPENSLSRKCLDPSKRASGLLCRGFLYRKNRALTPERGGKRTVRGGGPKPLFGRGVIREVFHPALFSTRPWRPPNQWEGAKVSHKRVFALLTPEIRRQKMARMLQKPVFALAGCQRMSVNTLLCDTLALPCKP